MEYRFELLIRNLRINRLIPKEKEWIQNNPNKTYNNAYFNQT